MMISTKGRYALRIMTDLASRTQGKAPEDVGFIPLKSIAERQEISMKYLEMIVSLLHRGGVVIGLRGAKGGYKLARPADQITVYEVIRLTEGNLTPVACLGYATEEHGCQCDRASACLTLPLWQKLDQIVTDYLSSVTIADLLDRNY